VNGRKIALQGCPLTDEAAETLQSWEVARITKETRASSIARYGIATVIAGCSWSSHQLLRSQLKFNGLQLGSPA